MNIKYKTKDTCAQEISFDLDEGVVTNLHFTGGCKGNLKAIETILNGCKAEDIVSKVKGITCGTKETSCSDQLALALEQALKA